MRIPKLPHCRVISLPHPETLTIILSLFQCLEYTDCSPVSQQCKVLIAAPIGKVQTCTEGLLSASKISIFCTPTTLLISYLGHCNRPVTIVFMATPTDCFRVYINPTERCILSPSSWNGCITFICAVQPSGLCVSL